MDRHVGGARGEGFQSELLDSLRSRQQGEPVASGLGGRSQSEAMTVAQASVLSLGLSRMSRLARRKGATVKVTLPLAPVESSLAG